MQISRHWRLNSLRYRLQGFRYEDGSVALYAKRSQPVENFHSDAGSGEMQSEKQHTVAVA